jgi:hypothetical protein
MVETDRILAAAIRSVWLQVDGPESPSPCRIEVEIARRVRIALEHDGIMMTPSLQTSDVWSRGARNEMSKQFFHKFLLNDTFGPAERFNPKLALGTVGRNVPGGLAGAISFS